MKTFLQIQRRRSVYESFLKNKIAGLFDKAQFPQSLWRIANLLKKKACNFIKKRFWHWCFPMNFAKFLTRYSLKNTSGAAASAKSIVSRYSLVFYAMKLIKNKDNK